MVVEDEVRDGILNGFKKKVVSMFIDVFWKFRDLNIGMLEVPSEKKCLLIFDDCS